MNGWLSLTCDRYGHLVTTMGGSSGKSSRSLVTTDAGPIGLGAQAARPVETELSDNSLFQSAGGKSPIRQILVPIDADCVRPEDLKPILKMARHLDAQITLLHCYTTPPSFDYAVGTSAMMEVSLHRNLVRTRLQKLGRDVQKFFIPCRCEFAFGSLPVQILRTSERLHSDLIAVPLSLDFVSHCWTTKELVDVLVRKASCPVLGVPPLQGSSR